MSSQLDRVVEGDTVIRGGTVVTMDSSRRVLRADVIVRGGRIVDIDGSGARREGKVIDAGGCAVVPGFVQAHVHLCQALFRGMADELPLLEWLRRRIWPLEAAHHERSMRASARLGLLEMMRAGTTTILDLGTVHHQDVLFETMRESGIRGFSGKAMMDRGARVPKGLRESTRESLRESERLCSAWHGAAEGRLGYAFAPRFILSCSERLLRETGEAARSRNALVHSHASEHRGERDEVRKLFGKDDVDVLADWGVAGPNVVLAHGVQLRRSQMRRIAKRGTRFVHCPSANLKLASGIADVVGMREAGIVVGIGADGAPCNNRMDPFTELRQTALLAKVRRSNAAALHAMDALAMITIDGARVLNLDHEVGSIEIGKKADLAIVRLDALHSEPGGDAVSRLVYSAVASDVSDVMIDGRWVLRRGQLEGVDMRQVIEDARSEARELVKRAGIK